MCYFILFQTLKETILLMKHKDYENCSHKGPKLSVQSCQKIQLYDFTFKLKRLQHTKQIRGLPKPSYLDRGKVPD